MRFERITRRGAHVRTADDRSQDEPTPHGKVDVMPSQCPSMFAAALARRLADPHGLSSTVHWGNGGFCVDIALRHPERCDDVTIGILSDGSRFPKAADAVEWDLFRTRRGGQNGPVDRARCARRPPPRPSVPDRGGST